MEPSSQADTARPKTTTRRPRRKKPAAPNGNPVSKMLDSVRIRMYRQGLGDCFLVSFTNTAGEQHHMIIDCGVLPFSKGGNQRLDLAAQDILKVTGNHVNTVVATHEHADHISGFASAAEYFGSDPKKKAKKKLAVDKVWLAWTEDLNDPQTRRIVSNAQALNLAVAATVHGLGAERSKAIQDILLFNGAVSEEDAGQGGSNGMGLAGDEGSGGKFHISSSMVKIMDLLRAWVPAVDFLEPGDTRTLETFGVKFHILGPSRKMSMLGGGAPAGARAPVQALTPLRAFLAAAAQQTGFEIDTEGEEGWSPSDIESMQRLSMPFDASRSLTLEEAAEDYPLKDNARYPEKLQAKYREYYQTVYGKGDKEDEGRCPDYYGATWRRIDHDWLGLGERLALQQVSTINNTSLVLAIELLESGKVLLFAADAEEDSWQTWEADDNRLDDLLARTVVYKVGHHGSVNATDPHMFGEKMCNKELVALIPVDVSKAKQKEWEFPASSLYQPQAARPEDRGLIYTNTGGRVVMNCPDFCEDTEPAYKDQPPWPGKLTKDDSPDRLWVDYELKF